MDDQEGRETDSGEEKRVSATTQVVVCQEEETGRDVEDQLHKRESVIHFRSRYTPPPPSMIAIVSLPLTLLFLTLTLLFVRYRKEIKNDRHWSLTINVDIADNHLQITLLEGLSQSPENRRHHVGCNGSSLVSVEHVKCFLEHFIMHGVG